MAADKRITPKHEPEVLRAKAKHYVDGVNRIVHKSRWATGDYSTEGGIYAALELAEHAHEALGLPYERGISNMSKYDPRRFTWFCDSVGDVQNCVKLRDNKTGRVVVWPHWSS